MHTVRNAGRRISSVSVNPLALLAALVETSRELGNRGNVTIWPAQDSASFLEQKCFSELIARINRNEVSNNIPGLKFAVGLPDVVNGFFRDHRLHTTLSQPWCLGTLTDLGFDWPDSVTTQICAADGQNYLASYIDNGVEFFQVERHGLLIKLPTDQPSLQVFLLPCVDKLTPLELWEKVWDIHKSPHQANTEDNLHGLFCPLIESTQMSELSYLVGLRCNRLLLIRGIVQRNHLRLGSHRQHSPLASEMNVTDQAPAYLMRSPFIAYVVEQHRECPLLAVHLGQDSWVKPLPL